MDIRRSSSGSRSRLTNLRDSFDLRIEAFVSAEPSGTSGRSGRVPSSEVALACQVQADRFRGNHERVTGNSGAILFQHHSNHTFAPP